MKENKSVKKSLIFSIVSLLLCVSMFVGSTFAWFTDSATTGVNTIQAGTLDVELLKLEGNEWVNAENQTLEFIDTDANLWEPGVSYKLPALKIRNNGSLALKYTVLLEASTVTKNLANVIDVAATITTEEGTVTENVGTLASLLIDEDGAARGNLAGLAETASYQLTFKMRESAGNEYQGAVISGISVTVVAAQDTVENDSNGNTYDKDAIYYGESDPLNWDGTAAQEVPAEENGVITISTPAELAAFAESVNVDGVGYAGKTIVLAQNIDLNWRNWTPIGQTGAGQFQGTFDGQGHTISNLKVDTRNVTDNSQYSSGLFGWLNNATVKNLTIKNVDIKGNKRLGAVAGYAEFATVIENVNVVNARIVAVHDNINVNDTNNCGDKVGGILGYANNTATIRNNTVEQVTIMAGRDAGYIVGAGYTSKTTGNTATNTTVISSDHGCKGGNIRNEVIGRVM